MNPGVYQMTAEEYHADPCPTPALSASLAKVLLMQSPLHAWHASPRLNPAFQREESERFDIGTAAHAYLLEGIDAFEIIDAADWRTKAAKEARDAAYAHGRTPLLASAWERVQAMGEAANRQLDSFLDDPRPFGAGKPEQSLVWEEDGIWCRARLDFIGAPFPYIDDYKTTDASANPEAFSRTLFSMGYDVQAAFYCRGVKAIFGVDPTFRFVAQETRPPYALSVVGLTPAALALANRKVAYAIALWGQCLKADVWPAYETRTCWAELPAWQEAAWMAKEIGGYLESTTLETGE